MEDSHDDKNQGQFYLESGFATRAIHAGEHVGQPQHVSHTGAIYQSSTFVFENVAHGAAVFSGKEPGFMYTRLGNPTVKALEAKLNALEGREVKLRKPETHVSSLAYSSGMGAIAGTLLATLQAGDTLLLGDVVYGATEHLTMNVLSHLGIRTVEVDTTSLDAVERAVSQNKDAKAFLLETPTNPLLGISDIAGIAQICHAHNPSLRVMVDNTFATPYLQRPLELGADVVLHSTTKYLCGHGTVVGGIMVTTVDEVKDRAYTIIKDIGSSPSPFDAWLVNLGVKTLPLRMDAHCANALAIARHLEKHAKIARVYYPGLESHPGHELAARQMGGKFGGVVSCELKGGMEAGRKLMDTIKVFTLAVSLGCVDSLIEHPASMTHACVPKDKRLKAGLGDGLVRISVGVENVEDLIGALDTALAKI